MENANRKTRNLVYFVFVFFLSVFCNVKTPKKRSLEKEIFEI